MFPIHEFTKVEEAFPSSVEAFMPKYKDIPSEYKEHNWNFKPCKFFSDMFFVGIANVKLQPREGVDSVKAWTHLQCIARSYEPKHEHKEAAFAFLLDEWFSDYSWEKVQK